MPSRKLLSFIKESSLVGRISTILAVIFVLVIAILLSGPKPVDEFDPHAKATLAASQPTLEIQATNIRKQGDDHTDYPVTTGVLVGAVAILLIIEIGTFLELRQSR